METNEASSKTFQKACVCNCFMILSAPYFDKRKRKLSENVRVARINRSGENQKLYFRA